MANIDWSQYDSSMFGDIKDSTEHSKENDFMINNMSGKMYIKENTKFSNPFTILDEYKEILLVDKNFDIIDFNKELWYSPSKIAFEYLNSHDLWYLILYVNNFMSSKYCANRKQIKIPNKIFMNTFYNIYEKNKNRISDAKLYEDLTIYKKF